MQVDHGKCFSGIRDCVNMSFHTHNVSLRNHFCNPDKLWMLLVLELQPSAARNGSQYLTGCIGSMSTWKFWYYAECSMDISGADDYRNCSVKNHPPTANPVTVKGLPSWVSVVIAVLASISFLLGIINLGVVCCICKKQIKL